MQTKPDFIYFSRLLKLPVINEADGGRIGKVSDMVANLKEKYPRITSIIVKGAWKKPLRIPWALVKSLDEDKAVVSEGYRRLSGAPVTAGDNEIFLRETFWDKQIVDTAGSKVVRVNDLHLLWEKKNLWVIHVDIGFKGFLRRLGWLKPYGMIVKWLFSYDIKDKFVSWKYVHPVAVTDEFKSLSLMIPQSQLAELHPADLADILIDLGVEERISIFKSLDYSAAADTLQELPKKIQIQIAESMEIGELSKILVEMPMDEVVDFLDEVPTDIRNSLYKILPREDVEQIKDLLKHSDKIAGSIMNTEFISVKYDAVVKDVLTIIRIEAEEYESIYYIYVVDDKNAFVGVVTLKQLLTADAKTPMERLMRKKVISVDIDTGIKKVAQIFFKYNFVVVPVLDEDNSLRGIITIKDALEAVFPVMREDTEEIS